MDESVSDLMLRMERRIERLHEQHFEFVNRLFEIEQAVVTHMNATDHPDRHDEALWNTVLGYELTEREQHEK